MTTKTVSHPPADAQHAAEERLATPEGKHDFIRATFSCWLGTTMEYADFALYGLAAGIIFGDVFFRQKIFVSSPPHWPGCPARSTFAQTKVTSVCTA